jgi:hypothetical protein
VLLQPFLRPPAHTSVSSLSHSFGLLCCCDLYAALSQSSSRWLTLSTTSGHLIPLSDSSVSSPCVVCRDQRLAPFPLSRSPDAFLLSFPKLQSGVSAPSHHRAFWPTSTVVWKGSCQLSAGRWSSAPPASGTSTGEKVQVTLGGTVRTRYRASTDQT